eukprot:TRINITY_DN2531_c0_g1_i1.p1 TRINITY_DN2531_c0_g1~~TRINITY_DN2531_c0_g1_i1.p1  ORF type:complete len:368 (-),score=53.20 TRINITY_DN2531_c0_g1_i1:217-1320(-)
MTVVTGHTNDILVQADKPSAKKRQVVNDTREDSFCVALFATFCLSCMCPGWLLSRFGYSLAKRFPSLKQSLEMHILNLTSLAWRLTFSCCWWTRLEVEGLEEFREHFARSGKPNVLLGNHTSFLDTLLIGSFMPLARLNCHPRMLAAGFIFKIPLLGDLARGMGHLEVPFLATGDSNDMSVEPAVMNKTLSTLAEHLGNGGAAVWYPEGRTNKTDSHKIQQFRAGAFKMLLNTDCAVWCIVMLNNDVCWPVPAFLGGRPCVLRCRIFKLCDSSTAYVKDTFANTREGYSAATLHADFANHTHAKFQEELDKLIARDKEDTSKKSIFMWPTLAHIKTALRIMGPKDMVRAYSNYVCSWLSFGMERKLD